MSFLSPDHRIMEQIIFQSAQGPIFIFFFFSIKKRRSVSSDEQFRLTNDEVELFFFSCSAQPFPVKSFCLEKSAYQL